MSADRDYQNALDTLNELREIGHDIPDYVANSIIDGLTRAARQMVNSNRMANGWTALREPEPILTLQRPEQVRPVSPPNTPPGRVQIPNTPPPIARQVRPSQLVEQIQAIQAVQTIRYLRQAPAERLTFDQMEAILRERFPESPEYIIRLYSPQIYNNYDIVSRANGGIGSIQHQIEHAIFEFDFHINQHALMGPDPQEAEEDDEDDWIPIIHNEENATPIPRPLPRRTWAQQWAEHKENNHTVRAIGRKRFEAQCEQDCAICLDRHTAGESVVASCGHEFGAQCWETWMSNPGGNHTCPTCRAHLPHTLSFKLRADRRPKNAQERNRFEGQIH